MKKVFALSLGIVAAVGGFVDISELVFNTQAGAAYAYDTLWAVPVGVIGIIVYGEMTGRIAAVAKRAREMDRDQIILANLCGRGDKDIFTVAEALGVAI